MKRILICAAAAIVALASCSKTQVVYNDAPEEIGFKAVTGVMTKAVNEWETASGIMGLFAVKSDDAIYLDNVQFKKDATESYFVGWDGSAHKPYYWPLNESLDFIVYAPYDVNADLTNDVLTISVDNSGEDQKDVLYGAEKLLDKPKLATPYSVNMKHALTWIVVNIEADQDGVLNVTKLDLTNIVPSGTLNVDYTTADAPELSWPVLGTAAPVSVYAGDVGTTEVTKEFLIIPAAEQTSFDLTYTLNGGSALNTSLDITGEWKAGFKYVYNISVAASEIKITPTVLSWDETTPDKNWSVDPEI